MRWAALFFGAMAAIFLIDRAIKELFLAGLSLPGHCVTLELVLNRGVAFSLFAFLGEWLKWILLLFVG